MPSHRDVYLRMVVSEAPAREAYEEYLAGGPDEPVTWHTWWTDWVEGIVSEVNGRGKTTYSVELDHR